MTKLTTKSLGCWVDGDNRGRYAGECAQQLAASYGWQGEQLDADAEWYDEAIEDATEYLNSLCDEGTYFTWENGSLFHLESERNLRP